MLTKHYLALALCLLCLLLGIWSQPQTSKAWSESELEALSNPFTPIDHLSFAASTEDLQSLKDALSDKQVVLLGEQLHQDGTTIALKSRLVRMLHEELDFNVLVYESGLYPTDLLWEKLVTQDSCNKKDFLSALWPFWVDNQESFPLIEYICEQSKTSRPLRIAGMDVQLSGSRSPQKRKQDIIAFFAPYPSFDTTSISQLTVVFDSIWYYANPRLSPNVLQQRLDSSRRREIRNEIEYLRSILLTQDSITYPENRMAQYLENISNYFAYVWQYRRGSPYRFHIRDSLMANNFFWLKEQQFPEEKVIVWLSNKHAMQATDGEVLEMGFQPVGHYLKAAYGEQAYSIGITSFARQDGGRYNASNINNSIETQLAMAGHKMAFVDFQKLAAGHLLQSPQYMRFDEGANRKGNWPKLLEAAIFIDTVKALTPISNE